MPGLVFLCLLFSSSLQAIPPVSEKPLILYVKGICCAGKTTLSQRIIEKWEGWTVVHEDPIADKAWLEAVSLHCPEEYASLCKAIAEENLYHALRYRQLLLKQEASEEECQKAKESLVQIQNEWNLPQNRPRKRAVEKKVRDEMIEMIRLAIEKGGPVFLDSWLFTADQIKELFTEASIIQLMIYCTLPAAYERLNQRNREAAAAENLEQKRYVKHLAGSFCELYEIRNDPSGSIHAVDKNFMECIFDEIAQELKDEDVKDLNGSFTFVELSLAEFKCLQEKFMQSFEAKEPACFYIAPKRKQDLIIDSTHLETEKLIEVLEEALK